MRPTAQVVLIVLLCVVWTGSTWAECGADGEGLNLIEEGSWAPQEWSGDPITGAVLLESSLELTLLSGEEGWRGSVAVWCSPTDYEDDNDDSADDSEFERSRIELLLPQPVLDFDLPACETERWVVAMEALEFPIYGEGDSEVEFLCLAGAVSEEGGSLDGGLDAEAHITIPLLPCSSTPESSEPFLGLTYEQWISDVFISLSNPLEVTVTGGAELSATNTLWMSWEVRNTGAVAGDVSLSVSCEGSTVQWISNNIEGSSSSSSLDAVLSSAATSVQFLSVEVFADDPGFVGERNCTLQEVIVRELCWSDIGKEITQVIALPEVLPPVDCSSFNSDEEPYLQVTHQIYVDASPLNPLDDEENPLLVSTDDWVLNGPTSPPESGLYSTLLTSNIRNAGSEAGLFQVSFEPSSTSSIWLTSPTVREALIHGGDQHKFSFSLSTNYVSELEDLNSAILSVRITTSQSSSEVSSCWSTLGKAYDQELSILLPSAREQEEYSLDHEAFLVFSPQEWEAAGGSWQQLELTLPSSTSPFDFSLAQVETMGTSYETYSSASFEVSAVIKNTGTVTAPSTRYSLDCSIVDDLRDVTLQLSDLSGNGSWTVEIPGESAETVLLGVTVTASGLVPKRSVSFECAFTVDMSSPDWSDLGKRGWDTFSYSFSLSRGETSSPSDFISSTDRSSSDSKEGSSPPSSSDSSNFHPMPWIIGGTSILACVGGVLCAAVLVLFAVTKQRSLTRNTGRKRQRRGLNDSTLEEFLNDHRDIDREEEEGFEEEMQEITLCECGRSGEFTCNECRRVFCGGPCWDWVHHSQTLAKHQKRTFAGARAQLEDIQEAEEQGRGVLSRLDSLRLQLALALKGGSFLRVLDGENREEDAPNFSSQALLEHDIVDLVGDEWAQP